jgi:hypothetical protein
MCDSDTCFLAISSVMCTKYTQNICIDIENNVSLQDNSDDPKESNQNGDMEWMRRLTRFNQKPVPVIAAKYSFFLCMEES